MAGIEGYSITPGSNNSASPNGWPEGMPPSGVNDSDRQFAAAVRAEWATTSMTATATLSIGNNAAGVAGFIHVCTDAGKSISQFDTIDAGIRRTLIFDVAATLVHHATKLIIPGARSVSLVAGDVIGVVSEGAGNWRVTNIARGIPATATDFTVGSITASTTISIGNNFAGPYAVVGVTTTASKSISSFDVIAAGVVRTLVFEVAATLVHDGTKLIIPGAASVSLAANDVVRVVSLGSGNWRVTDINHGNPAALGRSDQPLTGGVIVTSLDLGTISSSTVTPDPGDRPQQHYTNGGAHTLGVSSNSGSILVDITNNASAGAITTSGFTKVTGDSFTTTNGHKFRCHVSIGNGGSLLQVQALQ